jgi:hypothetical protein
VSPSEIPLCACTAAWNFLRKVEYSFQTEKAKEAYDPNVGVHVLPVKQIVYFFAISSGKSALFIASLVFVSEQRRKY